MLWIVLSLVLLGVAYYFLTKPHKYWIEKGVKQTNPWPIVGDNWGTLAKTQSFAHFVQDVYNVVPNTRYTGMYQFNAPILVMRDPDLIKQVTVKDFDHFMDHRSFVSADADPLFGRNLFALKGQKWRQMRTTLSPTFTSSKMRLMFGLMSEVSEQFTEYFVQKNENLIVVEMKDTLTRYTNDIIASAAFGISCDSLKEQNNEFYLMGKKATDFGGFWRTIKFFGFFVIPRIYSWLKISLLDKQTTKFFYDIVTENIASREKQGIVRPDMLNLLMEAKKNGLKYEEDKQNADAGFATAHESDFAKTALQKTEFTTMDIVAQALIFFVAGFDTASSVMCFMAYELAVNPDVQERLRQEIDEHSQECDGKLTYDTLLKMKYMDMVISESLRKWPPAVGVDRVCTKPYVIQPKTEDESPVHLKTGDTLFLPIFGLHRDPKYYPDPEKFDPERFNDDNKQNINPYAYIPFGSGPRNCIGSRFALLETKALFFHLLSKFEIVPVEKTTIPLKISRKQINLNGEGGIWVGFKRRGH